MAKIKIMVDTSAAMTREMLDEYGIERMNFIVSFGDESFVANEELTNDEFYKRLAVCTEPPKTAMVPYQSIYDAFLRAASECDTLIYYSISSRGSGQNHSAHLVLDELSEEHPELDIRIVDTMSYAFFIANAAMMAAKMAREGASADEIIEKTTAEIGMWNAQFVVGNLDFLCKGGRITKLAATLGQIIDIKPVLTVRDGLIEPCGKLRGSKKLEKKLIDAMKADKNFDSEHPRFFVQHSSPEGGALLVQLLREEFGEDTVEIFGEFDPSVGAHVGPGVIAVYYRLREK